MGADTHVFLEVCALQGIISAPTHTELSELYRLSEKNTAINNRATTVQLRNTTHHKTNVKMTRFEEPEKKGLLTLVKKPFSKDEASTSLRILVDFLKQEEKKEGDLRY